MHQCIVFLKVSFFNYLETIWVLLKNGDIAIYKCKSNPMSLHEEWNLLTRPGQQDKCVKLELIEYTLSSEEVTVLIGGTDTGQIVFLQDGKMEKIVQAHTASITSLLYDNKNMRLISGGGDNTVKIWSVITAKDEAKIGAISLISLSLITSVNIPSTPIHVFLNTGSLHGMTLAVATLSGSLLMYLVKDEKSKLSIEKLKDHPKDENHTLLISGLCGSKSLNIFATSSLDMTVKVWDGMDNSLLREVQFPSKLTSIAFLNKRGDLLVGLDTEICIIKVQDYLSFNLLRYIMDLEFPDDIQDSGILFDPMLDFWSNGREQLEKNGVELKTWHVEKSKDYSGINRKKTSDLLSLTPEELSNRAGLIKQRKIKRLYLEKERDFFEIARPYENVTLYTDASKLPPNYLINHDQDDKLEPTMVSEDKEDLLEEEDDEIVPIKFRSEKQRLAAEHVIEILMGGGRRQSKVQTSGSNISPARKDDIRKRMKSERRLSETKSDHVQLYSELFMKKDIEHTEKPAFQSTVTSNKPFNIPEFDFRIFI